MASGEQADETKSAAKVVPVDDLRTTRHEMTVGGETLRYTATTGRVVLRQEVLTEGKFDGHLPKAEVFLTAYTLDDADASQRPVTFAFNGGPGSSSIWLHLGLLGPRRVVSGDVGELAPPPYGLTDNEETLLRHSDLVFIDPVSTGYSRAAEGEKPGDYHGFTRDLESVGEVIRLWTSRNGRWMSPKFLAGESYGTTRAAGLAAHLQDRYGMYLNGVMLISAVLEFGTLDFTPGNDLPFTLFLPSYAAAAHYHGLIPDRELSEVLADAERFAAGRYPNALAQGNRVPADYRAEVVDAAGRADRTLGGLPRPGEPADRAHPLLRRAAALQEAGGRAAGQPVHRVGGGLRAGGLQRRPVDAGDHGALHGGAEPLRAGGTRVRERPAVRDHQQRGRPGTGPTRSSRTTTSRSPTSWPRRCGRTRI